MPHKIYTFFEGAVSYLRPLKRQIPLGCKAICNERDYKEDPSGVWSEMWDSCHFTSDVIMCILIIAVMEINPPPNSSFSHNTSVKNFWPHQKLGLDYKAC